ncbi:P-loop containing nucleoside triphosphate hydrolase protein [Xylariaceae sp. AK1471]|nr:P-loop containing nucleoside triphosphate hydrolase protein [Xylariaceae sp. AK1471]
MSLPIIYLTGAAACGKGTLGKMLAANFGFYHLSMGDTRRKYLEATKGAIPGMPDEINKHILEGKEIPEELLAQFNPVPVVLKYHNCRVNGINTWAIAPDILEEKMMEARAEGKHKAIIIDGFPLRTGNVSKILVRHFIVPFSGLTIVIESPREVAKKRYIERARLVSENAEKFEARAERTDRALPPFIELMSELGSVVVSTNDDTMTIQDAYNALVSQLYNCPIFLTLIQRNRNSI